MRGRLQTALDAAGFVPPADAVAGVADAVHTFCPDATPTAVDYYILTAHSAFAVPTDAAGNDLEHAGQFPFFTPAVMIDLFFATLLPACAQIAGDHDAIAVFGGGDASYDDPAKQAQILALWATGGPATARERVSGSRRCPSRRGRHRPAAPRAGRGTRRRRRPSAPGCRSGRASSSGSTAAGRRRATTGRGNC